MASSKQFAGFGQGVLKTREDGSQYVFDPVAKKSWQLKSAKGMYLMGQDPNKADKRFTSDQAYQDAYAVTQGGQAKYGTNLQKTDTGFKVPANNTPKSAEAPVGDIIAPTTSIADPTKPLQASDFATHAEYTKANQQRLIQQQISQVGVSAEREAQLQAEWKRLTGKDGLIPRIGQNPADQPTPPTPPAATTEAAPATGDAATATTTPAADTVAKAGEAPTSDMNPNVTATVPATSDAAGTVAPVAAPDIAALEQQAIAGGISQKNLKIAQNSFKNGTLSQEAYIEYLDKYQQKQVDATAATQSSAATTAATGTVDYFDEAHMNALEEQQTPPLAESAGVGWIGSTAEASLTNLQNSGLDPSTMTSADLARYTLMMTLDTTLDDQETKYFDTMAEIAKNTYEGAVGEGDLAIAEIDAALSGEDFNASTWEGLQAKIAAQGQKLATESYEADIAYADKQYEEAKAEDQRRNARMEGYLKAKLYAMGAEDSTAGLSIISENMHMAQVEMDRRDDTYNYNRAKMSQDYRATVLAYTGKIGEITMSAQASQSKALTDYQTSMLTIEKDRLASDKEKRASRLTALQSYLTFTQTAEKNANDEKWKTLDFYYKQSQDQVNQAFQWSGLMGTIYTVDPVTGEMVDTGAPTMEWQKYQSDYQLKVAELQLSQNKAHIDTIMSLVSNHDALAAMDPTSLLQLQSSIEREMGINFGGLGSDPTTWADSLQTYSDGLTIANDIHKYEVSSEVQKNITDFVSSGKPITSTSQKEINLDPFDIPGIKDTLLTDLGAKLTQEWGMTEYAKEGVYGGGPHRGVDVVWKDGIVKAAQDGIVTKIVPADGKNGYGGYVQIEDGNGLVWQYAHMPADAGAYQVQVGQQVSVGTPLGQMGNTGNSTGAHTDISIVGATQNALNPSTGQAHITETIGGLNPETASAQYGWLMGFLSTPTTSETKFDAAFYQTEAGQEAAKLEASTRKDFEDLQVVKNYAVLSQQLGTLTSAYNSLSTSDSGKAFIDQTLITVFNKMLDPTSVVRESEYARTADNLSFLQGIYAKFGKQIEGGQLSPEARNELYTLALDIYETQKAGYNQQADYFRGMAQDWGINPDHVINIGTTDSHSGGGQVLVQGPDGSRYYVSNDKLDSAIANGYTLISQ